MFTFCYHGDGNLLHPSTAHDGAMTHDDGDDFFAAIVVNCCYNRRGFLLHPFMIEIRPGRDGERCLILL